MKDHFFLAFNNLKRRKLRSWLTMIGIFIGIAAVVALISIGQGFQGAIEEQFENLGKDKIIIEPVGLGPPGSSSSDSLILKTRDLEFIEDLKGVDWAIGYLVKTTQVKFKDQSEVSFGIGMHPEDLELNTDLQGIEIIDGRSLKDGDKFKVVLGYNHGQEGKIWDREIRVGEKIEIEGQEFKVVGILGKIGNPFDDASIYLPKDTWREILDVDDEESQILVKVEEGENPLEVAEEIERKLRKFRGEKEGQETFHIHTSEQILKSFNNIFGIVQAVLVGIAGISLLVGGIGIMNTMYTSVIERTKEIGTMKAVGAKNSDVLMVFLFESGLLGLVGGAIGVLFGILMGEGAEYIGKVVIGTNLLQASFPWYLIVGSLVFSFLIGTLSGILPAYQASKLKPAQALRYE